MKGILFLFFLVVSINAHTQKAYKISVLININECPNCNKALFDLKPYNKDYDICIIFPNEFKADSAYIVNEYQIHQLTKNVIFSDQLFDLYSPKRQSLIVLESQYDLERLIFPMLEIYKLNFLPLLNRLHKKSDTLFDQPTNSFNGITKMNVNGLKLGVLKPFKKQVEVYDLASQIKDYDFSMNEEQLRQSYFITGLRPKDYDSQINEMKSKLVPSVYDIKDFSISEDSLHIILTQYYFEYAPQFNDLAFWSGYGLAHIHKGKYKSTEKINYKFSIEDQPYMITTNLHKSKDAFYVPLIDSAKSPQRYFLSRLQKNKYGELVPQPIKVTIPFIFQNTRDFSTPIFDQSTYCFTLIGNICSINDGRILETLPFFKNENKVITQEVNPENFIISYKISKDFVWACVCEITKDSQIRFYKMDRKTKTYIASSKTFKTEENIVGCFDAVNPDFFYYKNKLGKIIRDRLF